MSKTQSLGVVAIAFNEEQDLPGFFANLLPWVDEIVIVDDGSTDRTAELAKSAGDKVRLLVSPRGDGEYFSHQRNKGIAAAGSDWLLHLDIDERVPLPLAREIRRTIESADFNAYRYRRLNHFLHRPMRGGGWQDWNLVHLARRDALRFGGKFHETCPVDAPAERVGQLREKVWHLNEDSYPRRMRKSLMYSEELVGELRERQLTVRWWHLLWEPLKEFANKYVRKRGYRDATPGLLFALHASSARFKAVATLWDEQHPVERSTLEEAGELRYSDDDVTRD